MGYISIDDKDRIVIEDVNAPLKDWDMYRIILQMNDGTKKQIWALCDKGTFPKFSSDEYKELQQKYGTSLFADFFIKRFLGKEKLQHIDGHKNLFYLGGKQYKDELIASYTQNRETQGAKSKDDINRNTIDITEVAGAKLNDWDMYRIILQMNDGTKKQIWALCDKGTLPKFDSNEYKRLQ